VNNHDFHLTFTFIHLYCRWVRRARIAYRQANRGPGRLLQGAMRPPRDTTFPRGNVMLTPRQYAAYEFIAGFSSGGGSPHRTRRSAVTWAFGRSTRWRSW